MVHQIMPGSRSGGWGGRKGYGTWVLSGPEALVPLKVTLRVPAPPGFRHLPLSSSALTQKPDIHLPEPLQAGSPANLTCSLAESCEGGGPLLVAWVGDAVDSLDATTDPSSVLTLTPRPQDHGTNLTCQVTLQGPQVATERTIRLSVSCEFWRGGWVPEGSVSRRGVCPEVLFPEEVEETPKHHPFHLGAPGVKGESPGCASPPLTLQTLHGW